MRPATAQEALSNQAKDDDLAADSEQLTTRVSQVEEDIYPVRNRSMQDTLK